MNAALKVAIPAALSYLGVRIAQGVSSGSKSKWIQAAAGIVGAGAGLVVAGMVGGGKKIVPAVG